MGCKKHNFENLTLINVPTRITRSSLPRNPRAQSAQGFIPPSEEMQGKYMERKTVEQYIRSKTGLFCCAYEQSKIKRPSRTESARDNFYEAEQPPSSDSHATKNPRFEETRAGG